MQSETNSTAPSANNGATPTATVTEQVSAAPPSGPPTTPPATSQPPRPLTRRERPVAVFQPNRFGIAEADRQPPSEPPPPDDTIRVEYVIRIQGGKDVVVDVKSRFDLPMALREECLAKTDSDFPGIFDMVVVAPLTTRVRAHLQQRFEDYSEAKAKAAQEVPAHAASKPPNGSRFAMPTIDPMPPLASMPGQAPQPGGRNGN